MKIAVLGASGMLGSQVLKEIRSRSQLEVIASYRTQQRLSASAAHDGSNRTIVLDASSTSVEQLKKQIGDCDWWINCIGVIKPYIHDDVPSEVASAITTNGVFSARLAQAADETRTRLIQIATDCVWDGVAGEYSEQAHHNATDVYGKSKSIGEVRSEYSHYLRCSIIGRQAGSGVSLLDWFLGQPAGATVNGFQNHHWNGVTTLQFAKICCGIIEQDMSPKFMQHLIPADHVSKYELLQLFADSFNRTDIQVRPFMADPAINRVLTTLDMANNLRLWQVGGYDSPPTIAESVAELAGALAP